MVGVLSGTYISVKDKLRSGYVKLAAKAAGLAGAISLVWEGAEAEFFGSTEYSSSPAEWLADTAGDVSNAVIMAVAAAISIKYLTDKSGPTEN